MGDKCLYGSPKYGCRIKAVRGTWNFVWQQATLAQGCASEAHLNMDVNLRRLPDIVIYYPKFSVPLAGFIEHPHSADSAEWWNQPGRQSYTLTILRTNSLLASCPVFPDRMFSYNSPAKTSRSKRCAASEDNIEAALALLEIIGTSA